MHTTIRISKNLHEQLRSFLKEHYEWIRKLMGKEEWDAISMEDVVVALLEIATECWKEEDKDEH